MSRTLVVIVGVIALLSVAHNTSAFTTHPVDLSPPLSDSEGLRFQFTAPPLTNGPIIPPAWRHVDDTGARFGDP